MTTTRDEPPPPPWRTNVLGWPAVGFATGEELLGHLTGDRSARAIVGGVEAFVGFVTLVCVIFGGLGLFGGSGLFNAWLYHHPHVDPLALKVATAAWAVTLVLASRSAGFFMQALETAVRPVPLSIARRWLAVPAVARVPLACWWAGLSAVVLVATHTAAGQLTFIRPTALERAITVVVPVVLLYGSAFAVNTNLLIAVAALTGSDAAVRAPWRLRLVADLALVFVFLTFRPPALPW